jgi:hypothetical protein
MVERPGSHRRSEWPLIEAFRSGVLPEAFRDIDGEFMRESFVPAPLSDLADDKVRIRTGDGPYQAVLVPLPTWRRDAAFVPTLDGGALC